MWVYRLLTILLIFSLPFFTQQYINTFIQTSIVIFSVCLLPIFPKAFLSDLKRKFVPTLFFIFFLLSTTVSTIFSTDIEKSAVQLLLFYSYFIIFVSIPSIFSTLKSKELLTSYFLLLTSILSLISLYNTLIRHYVSRDALSFLWIYHGHNHLSALLVFAIPLSLYFLKTYWNKKQIRPLLFAVCCLLLISLLFTFSISAMFSLAVSFFIALALFGKTISTKKFPLQKVYFMVFLIIAIMGIFSFYVFSETKGIKTMKLWKNPPAYASARFIYWQAGYTNFLDKPLTGTGLDTFDKAIAKFDDIGGAAYTNDAHNFFVQLLSDTGAFGFLASVGLVSSVLWEIKNKLENGKLFHASLFTTLLSSTLLGMIDVDWHVPVVFLFFWIFAGLSTSYTK